MRSSVRCAQKEPTSSRNAKKQSETHAEARDHNGENDRKNCDAQADHRKAARTKQMSEIAIVWRLSQKCKKGGVYFYGVCNPRGVIHGQL